MRGNGALTQGVPLRKHPLRCSVDQPQAGGIFMQSIAVEEIQARRPIIPWRQPIRVQFFCDERPMYGCRLCILIFGLKKGDRTHLYATEGEALNHIAGHPTLATAPH